MSGHGCTRRDVIRAVGVGAAALHRLRVRPRSPAEEIAFAVPLGMGVLAYLLLAVGLLGQLKLWIGIALLALLALLSRRHPD